MAATVSPDAPRPAPRSPWPRIAAVFAGLAALVLLVEAGPRWAEALALAREARQVRARVAEADQAREELPALLAERERLEQAMGLAGGEATGLLGMLAERAEAAGVVLRRVEPGAPEPRGRLTARPVRVDVRGTGHGVGRFVDALERSERLVRVRRLRVRGGAGRPGEAPGVEATVEADVLSSTEEAGANTTAAPPAPEP